MGSTLAIEQTGLSGSSHTSVWRLLITLFALWMPTILLWGMLMASQGGNTFSDRGDILDGSRSSEPHGELTVVLTVPTASLLQIASLWLGWTVLLNEYRRHTSRHRRRRRKFLDKLMQRAVTVLIAVSMFASVVAFCWSLWHFYHACVPSGRGTVPI
jgi:hypothetical protein